MDQTQFFKGSNIINILANNNYGKIWKIIKLLIEDNTDELTKFILPRIITVGNESTGKSSLFEKILKCPIFPKNNIICTKSPIRLILKDGPNKYVIKHKNNIIELNNKQEILDNIIIINNSISPKNSDIISDDEIVIEFSEPNLLPLELIDLPGLRAFPPDLAAKTTSLCKKYLTDKDIILCVVPATVTRLTSCQPLALINELNLCKNTILALTMADRLIMTEYSQSQKVNIDNLLLNRILGTSDEMESLKLKGCVAIINRTHNDIIDLEESDNMEKKYFDKLLNDLPISYIKESINDNLSVKNLLIMINNLVDDCIQNNWKQMILNIIDTEEKNINDKIIKLGPKIIKSETIKKIFADYIRFLCNKLMPLIIPDKIPPKYNIIYKNNTNSYNSKIGYDTYKSNLNYLKLVDEIKQEIINIKYNPISKITLQNEFNNLFDKYSLHYVHKLKETLLQNINMQIDNYYDYENNISSRFQSNQFILRIKKIEKSVLSILEKDYLKQKELKKENYIKIINNLHDIYISTDIIKILENYFESINLDFFEDKYYAECRRNLDDRLDMLFLLKIQVNETI
ncbi:dynamin-like protein [Hokovirus HKV1]|uniref:Dynamin-like protein n=1 Tax=Hokovirus HKV1 TaxID=1977638 RepID=A0A1V0SGI2_9VIRU|nr:dynamin-like protein [Hokovirus HKV1]